MHEKINNLILFANMIILSEKYTSLYTVPSYFAYQIRNTEKINKCKNYYYNICSSMFMSRRHPFSNYTTTALPHIPTYLL